MRNNYQSLSTKLLAFKRLVAFVLILMFTSIAPLSAKNLIKIALTSTADLERSGSYVWAKAFADVLEKSGMEVVIYPSSTLGNEIVRTEQLLLGLLEVNMTGNQEVEMLSELYAGLELPFIFNNSEELEQLHDDPMFQSAVNNTTRPYGMRVVDFAPLGGMIGLFTANSPVHKVDDLQKLRMRAMSSVQLSYYNAWGVASTQVAWEEVPQALQTGIVNGYLNSPIVALQFGHGSQLDYFTDLQLQPSSRTVVMSEKWYQKLNKSQQQTVEQAILHARKVVREWNIRTRVSEFKRLESSTIKVIKLTDQARAEFREKVLPLYKTSVPTTVLDEITEFLNKIREVK